jgi:hypothetical protein
MLTRTFHFDEVVTEDGLVCAPDPLVAEAGAMALRAGGNAVDAAIGAAFAEGVVEPWSSGVGGSATMTIALRDPDRLIVVEGHMTVPMAVSSDQYPLAPVRTEVGRIGVFNWPQVVGNANIYGAQSVAVPGAVSALCAAQERYGRIPLAKVLEPAIALAADGFAVNWYTAGFLATDAKSLMRDAGCREIFLPGGLPLGPPSSRPAGKLVQAQLAKTLELIGAQGAEGFYQGEIAAAMVKQFRQVAQEIGLTTNVQKIVTMASIVEKETAVPEERPTVAGVYYNRLARNISLQADPSVIYAELLNGNYAGTLHHSDMSFQSAYNTYTHPGLPPGPIGNPGRSSLEAALHPAQTDYFYFVSDGNGHHRFSHSLEEHNQNVAKLKQAVQKR